MTNDPAASSLPPPVPAPAAPVPVMPMPPGEVGEVLAEHYARVSRPRRPPWATALGTTSIVVACVSILMSVVLGIQAYAMYIATVMTAAVATAGAGRPPPPVQVIPPVQVTPFQGVAEAHKQPADSPGFAPAEREALVAELVRRQPLTTSQRRQLDAILAAGGREMGLEKVTESGTMPEDRDGLAGPEYFVTDKGRLEIYRDRAVFFPTAGGETFRVSAPPPATRAGDPIATSVDEPVGEQGTETANAAPAGLSAAEVQSIANQAQTVSGNRLTVPQVMTIKAQLTGSDQQLVPPGAAARGIIHVTVAPDNVATVFFANGQQITLGPVGDVRQAPAAAVIAVPPPAATMDFRALALLVASLVLSVALAVLLLSAGLMALRQAPKSRRMHLVYATVKIPVAITSGLAVLWMIESFSAGTASAGRAGRLARGWGLGPAILACFYPLVLLLALNLKRVREYYASVSAR